VSARSAKDGRLATSLGPELVREEEAWALDLDRLPMIHGLSVLARALAELVVMQVRSEHVDIGVERRLRLRENPELIEQLGVHLVKVVAERAAVADIADHPAVLEHHLRALLGNLQRERYRQVLLPEDETVAPKALLADFSHARTEPESHRFLLEFVRSGQDGRRGFLRITIEDPRGRHLDLSSIPHVEIENFEDRTFIAGSTRIAQTWADLLRREAERGRHSLVEHRNSHEHLFAQLELGGLGHIESVAIRWGDASLPFILEGDRAVLHRRLKRVLLALEDGNVRALLTRREVVRVDAEGDSVFLDVSHLGRVLNLSLGERRAHADIESFLRRMPVLESVVTRQGDAPLAGVHVFLVHHITAEVLGLIAALRRLGCSDLTGLFVAYAGEAPASYLDALLNVPSDEFRGMALVNVPGDDSVEGHYRLSKQYSVLPDEDAIEAAIVPHRQSFFEAMRAAGVVAFLGQLERARATGQRLLLVEDGGYLAPLLNQAVQRGVRVNELAAEYGQVSTDARPLAELLVGTWIGSVEHTKNGYDRLLAVERDGPLCAPAFSIAVSRLKVDVEASEVSTSVLNAIENVLHANGRILSRRNALVIGSRGAIGRRLMAALRARLARPEQQLFGIDLTATGDQGSAEVRRLADAEPGRWHRTDLVVGVTGVSVLTGAEIEDWLLNARGPELALASGSTKTAEFSDVMAWIDARLGARDPTVAGHRVTFTVSRIVDPLTGRTYGQRYRIAPVDDAAPFRAKELLLLAQLTPVNFLFYGVPTELIDEVLGQLLTASLGLVRRASRGALPPRVVAVDHEIDENGEPLS
jgi:S-adenosylhomocysteine hydrolase